MLIRMRPETGCWYHDKERDVLFKVVAIDETQGIVDVQHFHGELEEIEIDTFVRMSLAHAEQPEDWTGPYELDDDEETQAAGGEPSYDFPEYESEYMQIVDQL